MNPNRISTQVGYFTFLGVIAALSVHAQVPQATWTLQPESSFVWSPDPYFGATGNNAYDIFKGISVDFKGYKHPPGGSRLGSRPAEWCMSF